MLHLLTAFAPLACSQSPETRIDVMRSQQVVELSWNSAPLLYAYSLEQSSDLKTWGAAPVTILEEQSKGIASAPISGVQTFFRLVIRPKVPFLGGGLAQPRGSNILADPVLITHIPNDSFLKTGRRKLPLEDTLLHIIPHETLVTMRSKGTLLDLHLR